MHHGNCLPKAVCHGPTGFSREELIISREELITTLEGVTRIVEAFGYTNALSKSQRDRLNAAKDLIKRAKQ